MTSEKKTIKPKEKQDFAENLERKSSVLCFISAAFLFVLCFRENVKDDRLTDFFSNVSIFPGWLWRQNTTNVFVWLPDINITNIFCISFDVCLLITVCCWGYLKWRESKQYRLPPKQDKSIKKNSKKDKHTHKAKYIVKTRNFFIGFGCLFWLVYAVLRNSSINTSVCEFVNTFFYLFFERDVVNVKVATVSILWASLVLVVLLLLIEFLLVFGWDYLRFGKEGFYKGGKRWYEEEKKYLVEGDFSFIGKLLFNALHCPQNILVKAIRKIVLWLFFILPLCLLTALIVFVGRLLKKPYTWLSVLTKKISAKKFKWLHPFFERAFKYLFEVRFKTVEEYERLVVDYIYQTYILFRYNSLLCRIAYCAIIVFVGLNIWCLLDGHIPPWSCWWTDNSWFGNFIKSSTVLKTYLCNPLDNLSFLLLFGLIVEKGARKAFIKSFLYERINMLVVIMSTVVAILLVLSNLAKKDYVSSLLFFDALFTVIFLIEIGMKIREAGRKFFFKENVKCKFTWSNLDKWNILDATVVIASITSIFMLKDEYQLLSGMYAMIVLRIIRLLKLVRLLRLFKKYLANLYEGAKHAMIKSIPIIIVFAILMFFMGFALYWASDYLNIGREFFKDPITSVVSLFQLFTYDGWTKIPNVVAGQFVDRFREEGGEAYWWIDTAVRIGFCALVFAGGIVGVALLNSVFVDGMMLRDKTEAEREHRLDKLDRKIEEINTKLDDMEKRRIQS